MLHDQTSGAYPEKEPASSDSSLQVPISQSVKWEDVVSAPQLSRFLTARLGLSRSWVQGPRLCRFPTLDITGGDSCKDSGIRTMGLGHREPS